MKFLLVCFFIFHCSSLEEITETEVVTLDIPPVKREFRAAWVATVANINWPSRPGLSTEEQKREAIKLLDFLQKHNFNAVIFQIRPQCDAFYSSQIEPWSYFLTGKQGKSPNPYYDPLEFWIKEAHNRGMELHAWLNPYRAHHTSGKRVEDVSIVKTKPHLVVRLQDGHYWLDPGLKSSQDYTLSVIMDVLRRYDVDGIHIDDYFYPYPSYNGNKDFPDNKSWSDYKRRGGKLSRGDWRRNNVNRLIQRIYKSIKKEKNHVKFGISPFGIWRPKFPDSIEGFDQYSKLYADARLWLNEGWLDYWVPQLYWPIEQMPQSYPVLLGWWELENHKNRHFWPGINVGRFKGKKGARETISQIMVTQLMLPENYGNVHWSIGSLLENNYLMRMLLKYPYKKPALVPNSLWLDLDIPNIPEVEVVAKGDTVFTQWNSNDRNKPFRWVVYTKYGETWDYSIYNQNENSCLIPKVKILYDEKLKKNVQNSLEVVAVSSVSQSGNESAKKIVEIE